MAKLTHFARALAPAFACALTLLGGCGDDESPVFLEMAWRVGCGSAIACVEGPAREVDNFDGSDGHNISCGLTKTSDRQTLTFIVIKDDYRFEVRNAQILQGTSAVLGETCIMTIEEGGNTFTGNCGPEPPSASCVDNDGNTECEQPCQINNVSTNDGISGRILCNGIPLRSDRLVQRIVADPSSDTEPVRFQVDNCD